jgi:hypothetical protein
MSTPTVQAILNYFTEPVDGSKPYGYINAPDPASGQKQRNWEYNEKTVEIENLRGNESSVSLDTSGFQFGTHPAKHTAFTDDKLIEEEYYPESIELIKSVTGASRVVLFDHTIRRNVPGQLDDSPDKRGPVKLVHVDQTQASAIARVHRHLPPSDAPDLLKRRFQIINLWRPIENPAWENPLALCDFSSTSAERDLVPTTLIYPDREGQTASVKFSPEHRWKYVKGMRPDEYVLIKCFDSKEGVASFTPHTAFIDPTTPADAPLRQSIELRALVFYD